VNIYLVKKNNKTAVNIYALEKTCDCWAKTYCKFVTKSYIWNPETQSEVASFELGPLVEEGCKYEYLQEDSPDWYQYAKVYKNLDRILRNITIK
tara:strand:+ start:796 stop:1077 length:282 start_codon:yes stop_codon:yes gene_type:complete